MNGFAELLSLHTVDGTELLLRLGSALMLGGIIGFDREIRDKPAGLRTNMLVSLAAATYTLLALELPGRGLQENAQNDITRVIEAVTAGAAFLGTGAIIHGRASVQGMTTGATIWLTGAIGLACGGGFYLLAALNVVLGVVVLTILGFVSHLVRPAAPKPGGHPRGDSADG